MKVLINSADAAFLRQVLQAILNTAPFDREGRRKLRRLEDKLSASRAQWGNVNMKRRELVTLQSLVARSIRMLETEIKMLAEPPTSPEEGTPAKLEERAQRTAQLELYAQYATTVQAKLIDTLGQDEGQPEYISQSAHKCEGPVVLTETDTLAADEFSKPTEATGGN